MKTYGIIMAGGVGSRFWPLSRQHKPKQFLDILNTGKTLIQQSYERLRKILPAQNIFVVTNNEYFNLVHEQLPELPVDNILLEPLRKNTAPCIAYAAFKLIKTNPDAIMIVTPADHKIDNTNKFIETLEIGVNFIQKHKPQALITIGIKPTHPETGYGYIQIDVKQQFQLNNQKIYKVKTFTEKPDYDTAKVFVESKEFYWNSGIFIWKAQTILNALQKYQPDLYNEFAKYQDKFNTSEEQQAIEKIYSRISAISIDYAVMEREKDNTYVILADFGWSDLGTWGSLYNNMPKSDEQENVIIGNNVVVLNAKKNFINVPDDKLVVVLGLENIIVAEADGMLLIANRDQEQLIRQVVNKIKVEKGDKYV